MVMASFFRRSLVSLLLPGLLAAGIPWAASVSAAEIPSDGEAAGGVSRETRVERAGAALRQAGLSRGEAARRARSLDERELTQLDRTDPTQKGGEVIVAVAVIVAITVIVVVLIQHLEKMDAAKK